MSITSNKLCWMGILMLAAVSGTAQAGVSLDRTRLIITGKDSSASANLTNTSPDIPFLAQSWVEDSKGNKITSPLVVLPPLQRINGGQKGVARVTKTDGINQLPQDRESLFYLSVREIPPKPDKANVLQLAMQSRIKLFFRPEGLKGTAAEAVKNLKWSLNAAAGSSVVTAKNDSPFNISIASAELSAGGKRYSIESHSVKPFSSENMKIKGLLNGTSGMLNFVSINDFGGSENHQIAITR